MNGNFKIILLVVFIAAAIFGLLVFSGTIPLGSNSNTAGSAGTVVLWGTVRADTMAPLIEEFNTANPTFIVKYQQKYVDTFNQDLLEALASGTGPDMFFMTDDLAYEYSNKIYTIPYTNYPLSTFKNTFVGAGEVFLTSKGMLAFPLTVDPMVMYYNRSILNNNNITYPPTTWDEIGSLTSTLTKKDDAGKIIKSTVALGQFSNINNAKDILVALFMQVGSSIVTEKDGTFYSALTDSQSNLSSVLKFYTSFADPLNSQYTWNKSLINSSDAFSAENLAFYFGYASELSSLVSKNPNQDFLAAPMPQLKNANNKITSAHVTGIAISASSKNFNTAFTAASLMATGDFAGKFANATFVVPARRDLLSAKLTDAFFPVFYSSALYARSWLDPSPANTDNIFQNMTEGVLSNNLTTSEAVSSASDKLDLLLH